MPPVITTAPPPFVAVKKTYDTVILQCAARGSPVPTLEWRKDGAIISANTTSDTEGEVTESLLFQNLVQVIRASILVSLRTTTTELRRPQPLQVPL